MIGISKGYEPISVEIVDYNTNIAEHIWDCYKMTWREFQNKPYDINDSDVIKAINNVTRMKALPMPREQALITFRINNISRVCLAQLTRQRKAAFNVESQMPQPVSHNVIVPLNIATSEKFRHRAAALINASQKLYDDMIDDGVPYQDARYLLMHGQTTSCVYVADINTFVGSFAMRCENNLSDEINLMYRLCLHAFKTQLQFDLDNDNIDQLTHYFYTSVLKGCDCMGARQRLGMNTDAVFGNSFNRFKDADNEVSEATRTCACDYQKSAWYLELLKLYDESPELLFDGEKEMIERWKEGNHES